MIHSKNIMGKWEKNLWILWCTQIISIASFNFGVPFIPLYIKELQTLTDEQVKLYASIILAMPAIFMGIMAPIWGVLADKYGRKLMLIRAMGSAVILIALMGMARSVNHLIVLRIFQGLFTGTITASLAFVSSNTPEEHLSYSLGVISSSTFIGFSVGPALGGIFAELYGYRISFFIGGILMFFDVLLVLFFLKENKMLLNRNKTKISIVKNYKSILSPVIISALTLLLFLRIARTMFIPYMPLFVESKLQNKVGVSITTGIINALIGFITACASIIMGKFIAKRNKTKTIAHLLIISFICSVLVSQYHRIAIILNTHNELAVFVVLYLILFFAIGGIEPIITLTAASNVLPQNRGALSGLQGTVSSLGWALAPVISGTVIYGRNLELVLYAIPTVLIVNICLSIWLDQISNKGNILVDNKQHN